jgi:hypothetical protein
MNPADALNKYPFILYLAGGLLVGLYYRRYDQRLPLRCPARGDY